MFKKGQKVVRVGPSCGDVENGKVYVVAKDEVDGELSLECREGIYLSSLFTVIREEKKPLPNYWGIPNWVLAVIIIVDTIVVFWRGY